MKPARPVNLFDLPPDKRREIADTIDRHPASNRQTGAGSAVTAGPAEPDPGRGSTGKRDRWTCFHCGEGFSVWAKAERHRHPGHCGGDVGRLELVLK